MVVSPNIHKNMVVWGSRYIYINLELEIYIHTFRLWEAPRFDNEDLGDTSTLADPSVVEVLKSYHPRKTNGYKS